MIHKPQLRELVTFLLQQMANQTGIEWIYSQKAVELILGTIAQESHGGTYIKQLGSGPALGICQMEPRTHDDIWDNYIQYDNDLIEIFDGYNILDSELLSYDLKYSIIMCRIHYMRVPEAIPDDLEGQASYWKKYYNTYLGKGTVNEYVDNYKKFVEDN